MHILRPTPVTNIAPLSASTALPIHQFTGISWHILMPYSILGALIMIFSHVRLVIGQREIDKLNSSKVKAAKPASKRFSFKTIKMRVIENFS